MLRSGIEDDFLARENMQLCVCVCLLLFLCINSSVVVVPVPGRDYTFGATLQASRLNLALRARPSMETDYEGSASPAVEYRCSSYY